MSIEPGDEVCGRCMKTVRTGEPASVARIYKDLTIVICATCTKMMAYKEAAEDGARAVVPGMRGEGGDISSDATVPERVSGRELGRLRSVLPHPLDERQGEGEVSYHQEAGENSGSEELDPTSLEARIAFSKMRGYQSVPPEKVMKYWVTARKPSGEESIVNLDCVVEYMDTVERLLKLKSLNPARLGDFALRIAPMNTDQLHNLVMMLTFRLAQAGKKT